MTRLDETAWAANEHLSELGFVPLDSRDGQLGGDRHGVWDYSWISYRVFAPHSFVSLLSWPANEGVVTEVWARVDAPATNDRSLVLRLHLQADGPDERQDDELVAALLEAAQRAPRLGDQRPRLVHFEQGPESERQETFSVTPELLAAGLAEVRAPYAETLARVERLLSDGPRRMWTNQQVLRQLLASGFLTDRADVNSALSELAGAGRARRHGRGRYSLS
jgi:hypothetical protein